MFIYPLSLIFEYEVPIASIGLFGPHKVEEPVVEMD
jgi:hypothetical protein